MSQCSIVLVTTNSLASAEEIAKAIVTAELAAGVNFFPIRSIYRWQGTIHDESEYQLIIQAMTANVPGLIARVKSLHPYEIPEIVAIDIAAGYPPYLDWICGIR
jgi:periplasmic divalent cation tolerance protein